MSDLYIRDMQHQVNQEIETVKGIWKDELGKSYIHWLEEFENKMRGLGRVEECIIQQGTAIRKICEEINGGDSGGDDYKSLSKKR